MSMSGRIGASTLSEREATLQEKRLVLAELRSQVQAAADASHKYRSVLAAATQQYVEKKRIIDEKVASKEAHNAGQRQIVSAAEQQERQLQEQIQSTERSIEAAQRTVAQKERENVLIQQVEQRLVSLKNRVDEEDASLMQLEARVHKADVAGLRRHSSMAEAVPHFPLPQLSLKQQDGTGLEATATESIILVG